MCIFTPVLILLQWHLPPNLEHFLDSRFEYLKTPLLSPSSKLEHFWTSGAPTHLIWRFVEIESIGQRWKKRSTKHWFLRLIGV